MTITVSRLHRILGTLIEQGHGRLPVCVFKTTFQHNLEEDGAVILAMCGIEVRSDVQIDDDGGTKVNSKGHECYRTTAVIFGSGHEPSAGALPRPRRIIEQSESAGDGR